MNEVLKTILSLSLSGSIMIAILFLFRPLYRERLSRRWQYYIWLVVAARLLLPFAPQTNIMGTLFQGFDINVQQEGIAPSSGQNDSTLYQPSLPLDNAPESEANGSQTNESEQPAIPSGSPLQNMLVFLWNNMWVIWLVTALVVLIRKITIYQSFAKYIHAGCTEVSDIDQLELFGRIMEREKIKGSIELFTNNMIATPLLIGFFRPSIILPTTDLSPSDFQYTLLHELTHYKRGDMFYKWLLQITVCIHWFNPLVYFMIREINRSCELSCDEAVIRLSAPQERRAYGDTLLNAVGAGGTYQNSLASMTLNESKELLKERLDAIMNFQKKTKICEIVSVALAFLLFSGTAVAGAYTTPGEPAAEAITENDQNRINIFMDEWANINDMKFYFLYSEEDLRSIGTGKYTLDKSYMLANDIEMSEEEWIPIGTAENPFTGRFEGNGCEIKGLTMKDPDAQVIGLIGYAKGAVIHNVTLTGLDISTAGQNVENKHVDPVCALPEDCDITDIFAYPTDITAQENVMKTLNINEDIWYLVETEDQLRSIGTGEYGLDKNYLQNEDIVLSDEEWISIGTKKKPFTGRYDGNRFKIQGLTQTDPDVQLAGMFGVAEHATLCNITLIDYDIETAGRNTVRSAGPIVVFASKGTQSYNNTVLSRQDMEDNNYDDSVKAPPVFNITRSGKNSITESSSFEALDGQILTLTIQSDITDGSVDLILFSPEGKEQRITIVGSDDTKTIDLSEGKWTYHFTGSFKSGDLSIIGTVE